MNAADYDPELPFLADLEERIRARAQQAQRPRPASSHAARPGRRRSLTGPAARITRRTAILVALLCLLGASAFGARAVFFTGAGNPAVVRQGAFVLVAQGHDGADAWTLRLYARGGELCRALVVLAQAESSRCAPTPAADTLGVTSLVSTQRRYVFGVAGSRVRAVTVRAGAAALTVATHALGGQRARAAGLSSSTRYFLAILRRPEGRPDPPAIVTGLDAAHHRIGDPRVNCLEEAGPPPCGP